MIEDLEWRLVEVDMGDDTAKLEKQLWASDGHVWFPVPISEVNEND